DPRLLEYASNYEPLLIWDPLVHFHDGDEQSSTETRAFMKHFRELAHAGATVLILHHTGKAKSSQQYRGSSDIPAAVDMGYTLKASGGGLQRLTLEPFKSRFAPLPEPISMTFREGQGFELTDAPTEDVSHVVEEIISAEPGLNGQQIVKKASGRAGKNKVRD